jgi:hypothetical protein
LQYAYGASELSQNNVEAHIEIKIYGEVDTALKRAAIFHPPPFQKFIATLKKLGYG